MLRDTQVGFALVCFVALVGLDSALLGLYKDQILSCFKTFSQGLPSIKDDAPSDVHQLALQLPTLQALGRFFPGYMVRSLIFVSSSAYAPPLFLQPEGYPEHVENLRAHVQGFAVSSCTPPPWHPDRFA